MVVSKFLLLSKDVKINENKKLFENIVGEGENSETSTLFSINL